MNQESIALQPVIESIEQSLAKGLQDDALIKAFLPKFKAVLQHSEWLSAPFKQPNAERYQQYLLYLDPQQRFSIVSFVWYPQQQTPIHNHQVWGAIGVIEGAELSQDFNFNAVGKLVPVGARKRLNVGDIDWFTPETGDIHQVFNAYNDQLSISIHIYGANIGTVERYSYTPDGNAKAFISGYSNQ